MKILYSIILSLSFYIVSAQSITDYKYIAMPNSFSGFDSNQYQLNDYLKIILEDKGYVILSASKGNWPQDARLNPCYVIHADVIKQTTSNVQLAVKFKDCNQTEVYSQQGSSTQKSFEEAYQEALYQATEQIGQQSANLPTYRQAETKQVTIITTKPKNSQEILPLGKRSVTIKNTQHDFQKFTYEGQSVYITPVENGQYLLTSSNKSQILAHFYPSSVEGIYHVKVYRGNQQYYYTIGYYDNLTLWYEYTDDNETWTKIEFDKVD